MLFGKKGGVHTDWIISAGIFLVYIFSLFIFIRPSAAPDYDSDVLLNIIEENLKNEIYVNVSMTPVFKKQNGLYEMSFPFRGSSSGYKVINEEGDTVSYSIGDNFRFNEDVGVYWLFYSRGKDFPHDPAPNCPVDGCQSVDSNQIIFGATEIIQGVSSSVSFDNSETGYLALKQEWNFPENKEFAIRITYPDSEYTYEPVEPFQQAKVYVREWKDWELDTNTGAREEVTINVRVW